MLIDASSFAINLGLRLRLSYSAQSFATVGFLAIFPLVVVAHPGFDAHSMGIDVVTSYVPFFKSGQLVPLAVTGNQRSPLMPDVPTIVELKQPKLVLENFFGLSGPAKLSPDPVTRLNTACNDVLVMPEIQKKLTELGIVAKPETVAMFDDFVKDQVGVPGRWSKELVSSFDLVRGIETCMQNDAACLFRSQDRAISHGCAHR